MRKPWGTVLLLALGLFLSGPGSVRGADKNKDKNRADRAEFPNGRSMDRIAREVRHELVMLPYYGVFDNLAFRVDGSTVTLLGEVTRPTLKSDAENVVKGVEGVTSVNN